MVVGGRGRGGGRTEGGGGGRKEGGGGGGREGVIPNQFPHYNRSLHSPVLSSVCHACKYQLRLYQTVSVGKLQVVTHKVLMGHEKLSIFLYRRVLTTKRERVGEQGKGRLLSTCSCIRDILPS